jgi:hypothetical protein
MCCELDEHHLKDHTFIKTQDDTFGCGNPIAHNLSGVTQAMGAS